MLDNILKSFGLNPTEYQVHFFGSGLINHTMEVTGNGEAYILQQINANVFKSPQQIAGNLALLQSYFKKNYPDYLFVGTLPAISGENLVRSDDGDYYRLFPFIKNSVTVNVISDKKEAYEAAKQFGKFTSLLNNFDVNTLGYTLVDFHNLNLRFYQFTDAVKKASPERLKEAAVEIREVYSNYYIVQTYNRLIGNNEIPVRVIHHDTKISNVLFDHEQNGLCVIDLDTVMPGYYLSDAGDMMRTYLSAASEEETDLSKIGIREDVFSAVCKGYLSEMGNVLTQKEKQYFTYSGELMIYMQAIRFLTDFLNNDIYYGSKYPGHNLMRAKNQFRLLNEYVAAGAQLKEIIYKIQREVPVTEV